MVIQESRKDSSDIAIDDGGRVIKGKATHSSGCVATNPGEGFEGFSVGGEFALKPTIFVDSQTVMVPAN